jgi:hypothetical protein
MTSGITEVRFRGNDLLDAPRQQVEFAVHSLDWAVLAGRLLDGQVICPEGVAG